MPRRALVELIARRKFFLALHDAAILADSRLLFAFATSAYDLSRFCITRGHDHFLHLYFTWLLFVNDSSLRSQLLLYCSLLHLFSLWVIKASPGRSQMDRPKNI